MEVGFYDVYSDVKSIDMPKRPPWTAGESKEELEQREEHYFAAWKDEVYSKHPAAELSYFEHNLEVGQNMIVVAAPICKLTVSCQVWRQLWRVAEIS